MHDSTQDPSISPDQPLPTSLAEKLEENDLLRFQLAVAHLGLAKQEDENLRLKQELAQQRLEQAKTELGRVNRFVVQKYSLVEGVDHLNYATGEIKRGQREGGSGDAT